MADMQIVGVKELSEGMYEVTLSKRLHNKLVRKKQNTLTVYAKDELEAFKRAKERLAKWGLKGERHE